IFATRFDSFNPLSDKIAGKKVSVGALFITYLNLPPEEQFKPENIFLAGIILGPHEPSSDGIQSYFSPIVDFF
ncbi:hypothetical protein ARMGADRAFT_942805, partial [Armillaria gallica]